MIVSEPLLKIVCPAQVGAKPDVVRSITHLMSPQHYKKLHRLEERRINLFDPLRR